MVVVILFWPVIVAIAAELSLVLAMALILVVLSGGPPRTQGAGPEEVDLASTPLTMHALPFSVLGLTANQLAQIMSTLQRLTQEFFRRGRFPDPGTAGTT